MKPLKPLIRKLSMLLFICCILLLVLALGGRALWHALPHPAPAVKTVAAAPDMEASLRAILAALEVPDKDIRIRSNDSSRMLTAQIPRGSPIEYTLLQISSAAQALRYSVDDCVWNNNKQTVNISLSSPLKTLPRWHIRLSRTEKFVSNASEAAILVTGFNIEVGQTMVDILAFDGPLTVSLPAGSDKSRIAASTARSKGKEVVLELPFESAYLSGVVPVKNQLLLNLSEQDIGSLLGRNIEDIGGAAGFMTMHPVSPAFNNQQFLEKTFKDIRRRQSFFLEQERVMSPLAHETARAMGLRYARVSVRIDGRTQALMEEQLRKCAETASRRTGFIIAGPPSRNFMRALSNCREIFRENGVQLVTVSAIASEQ